MTRGVPVLHRHCRWNIETKCSLVILFALKGALLLVSPLIPQFLRLVSSRAFRDAEQG